MKIAVIGGGASGITAAIFAKRENSSCKVTVYEKNDRILKKILSTGNGRCNLSNKNIDSTFYYSSNTNILKNILSQIPSSEIKHFFESIGIIFCEENQRLYPYSKRAGAVCDALRFEAEKLGIEILCNSSVEKIIPNKDGFFVNGTYFDTVIISAGGNAAPLFGTDGNAFKLLKNIGHTISSPQPALVPVKVSDNTKSLKGIRAQCSVTLKANGDEIKKEYGELQFTDFGLSGIVVMQLSRLCKKGNILSVDFMPDYKEEDLYTYLLSRKVLFSKRRCDEFLIGILHKPLTIFLLEKCGVKASAEVNCLNEASIKKLAHILKSAEFSVLSTMGWSNAQTTCGGALLQEFYPETLESKIQKNLYCTGEALDSVGDCGGYNLHWAWLTGMLAGKAAAKK